MTVSALARRFDVKVASLYSHLKNSHDLKTGIALLALEELADRGAAALAGRAGKDALAAFADVYRDYARRTPRPLRRGAAAGSTRRRRPPAPVCGTRR